jgi:hypothetical protein
MLRDIAGTAEAFLVFSLFGFVPGYSLAWTLNLLDFRRRTMVARVALAIALSIGVCPIIAFLSMRFAPRAVWLVFAPFWLTFAAIAALHWRTMIPHRYRWPRLLAVAWLLLGTASLIDLQWGDRLYYPVIAQDYTLRVSITSAITRAGVPPPNPYFALAGPVPLRYHYFWMIVCSLAQRVAGSSLDARWAAFGGTLWCGLGLIAILALYLRFADPQAGYKLERRLAIAIALLGVTGLDLIPTVIMMRVGVVFPDMEWWNEQVTSWVGTMLWVPHHLAALIACLTGFLLLWSPAARRRDGVAAALAAGLCFASAAGCSVYVTITFAIFLAIWGLVNLLRGWYRDLSLMLLAGATAAVLVLPTYLLGLRGKAAGGAVVAPAIRAFKLVDLILLSRHVAAWKISLANLLLLPLNYFLEFGFYLLVAVVTLQAIRRKWSRWNLAACTLAATSFAVATFLRSAVIANNDLGFRGFLPAQFILLLWAANLLAAPERRTPLLRAVMTLLLLCGAAGSLYELCQLRFYPVHTEAVPTPEYPWLATDHQFGRRTYRARQIYEQLKATLPAAAVIQHNPDTDLGDIPHGLYADRQLAAEGFTCGAALGGDPADCTAMRPLLDRLFTTSAPIAEVDATCRQFAIQAVVVRDLDPVWADPHSWIWTRRPIAANSMYRALPCGSR